jgi:diguanylate cyclase (GGDEF)-like protein
MREKDHFDRGDVPLLLRISCAWALAILLLCSRDARALDPLKSIAQYAHETWNTKNGLPEADVMAILQTRDGYLWLGTEEGLARFDGARFVVFDRKTSLLPNNRVQVLAETADGSLWVGTENGLSRFKDRRFTNFSLRDGLPSANIRGLWAEPGGALWVTTSAGVRVWRGNGFAQVPSVEEIKQQSARQVLQTAKGDTWVATDAGLSLSEGSGRKAPAQTPLNGKLFRTMMLESPDGPLWVGTNAGLYRLAEGRLSSYPLGFRASPEITALLEDRGHNLWVGTLGDGLVRVNGEGVVHYSVGDGLSAVEVKSLYEDKAGNLWVGTFGGGVEVFRDTMFTPYGKPEGVSQNVVWTVLEDHESSLWIGTQGAGLNRLKDGKVTAYAASSGFADNTVGSLFEGPDGALWLGKDSGLSKFSGGRLVDVPLASGPFREQVHAIYQDHEGTVWVGTRTSGLVLLHGAERRRLDTSSGLAGNNVQAILPSRNGGLWIGTLSGLSHYQNDHFTNLTRKDGLSADQVISLYEDREGTLWIGSDGLNRLKDGTITVYGEREGLFDQNILAILEDDDGYLWLSSNKGIFRVAKKQLNDLAEGRAAALTVTAFGTADGMRNVECNGGSSPAAWKDHRGNLWFPTVAGALKVDPRGVSANAQPLQVHIEDIWADRKYVAPSGSITLPPGGHELEVHYSAPYFAGENRVRYRYQLEGFDKEWVDAGSRTVAYYTNLPPGDYRFRVVAAGFNATPGEVETGLDLQLSPHFYQRPVFYAVGALAAAGLVLLVWGWANRVMIARQNELKWLVEARTQELEAEKAQLLAAKTALAQQVRHDPLTGLLNRAAIFHILEEDINRAAREKTSLAVLLVDLDHFKEINDTYGHLVGDEVLCVFARGLEHNLRPYDHAGRFGGEEFLIVMPGFADKTGERLRDLQRRMCQKYRVSSDHELTVTCSVGVAWFDPEIESTERLLKLADDAMYAAKANGRNRVETAESLPAAPAENLR